MKEPLAGVQAKILKWARLAQGYTIEEVAGRLNREASEITAWESGKSTPTYFQLEKLAYEIYRRPLALFFLPEAPDEISPSKEFRTLPENDLQELHPNTRYQLRLAQAFQISLMELNGGKNPCPNPIFRKFRLLTNQNIK